MSAAEGLLSLTFSAFMIVSVCVYSTGCTSLCQWVFTVQAVQGCVSGCLQYRLYKPVRPYFVASNFGVFVVRDFLFQQLFPVVLSDSKYSYFKTVHPGCVGL